jgi:8-oxo-dGTP pyrophosphatase MutT (NUDIX family)
VTDIKPGVVDVFVIRPVAPAWKVLVLQRAVDTRCPGAWETIHGRIEPGERPEHAALREIREEAGLDVQRLYSITVHPFYLHAQQTVQLAIVFAAFVAEPAAVVIGPEHRAHEWLSVEEAIQRFVWPRERSSMREIVSLLAAGDAGPVEDVLRIV